MGHIALVTGDAPYLGGPATWSLLHRAAPEFEFVEVDLLDARGDNLVDAARLQIEKALFGARAIVAHGTATRIAIEAVALANPSIPVLLLSPRLYTRDVLLMRGMRALAGGLSGYLLTSIARKKLRHLLGNPSYVRKQLNLLVRSDCVSDELLDEACGRIGDPRMDFIVDRTSQMLRGILTPIDAATNGAVSRRMVLLGEGPMDLRERARGAGTVLREAWAAPMLESPQEVARGLRALLAC